jgi:hypothetical protein
VEQQHEQLLRRARRLSADPNRDALLVDSGEERRKETVMNTIRATLWLAATLAAQSAFAGGAQPDLVPSPGALTAGTVGVVNQGGAAAPASVLTLHCQRIGGGSCPDSPGMAAYENVAFPDHAVVQVPALAPGGSFQHALTFWNELDWAPGTYILTLTVDAGGALAESVEANNTAAIEHIVVESVGSGPATVGNLAVAPARTEVRAPVASDTLVHALPDVMATTLGFVLGSPHPWGSTIVVDLPHLATTRWGPLKNLCRFDQAAYRAFNKGSVVTGMFKNQVLRNGTPVHAANLALGPQADQWVVFPLALPEGPSAIQVRLDSTQQVSESNESNNLYHGKVVVNLDCDGDGKVAGQPGFAAPTHAVPSRTVQPAGAKRPVRVLESLPSVRPTRR